MKIEAVPASIAIDGKKYNCKPATIKSTMLGFEDHGIMSFWLTCDGDGWGIGVGGYALDSWEESKKKRVPSVLTGAVVAEVLECLGVESWEKLPGTRIHVLFDGDAWGSRAKGITNYTMTKAVVLDDLMKEYKS